MNITKRIVVGIACVILPFTLLSFGLLASTNHTLSNAENMKTTLHDSNIYTAIVEEGLQQMGEGNTAQATANIPINRPEIRAIIEQYFPPEFLEAQTGIIIDSFFLWLHGHAPTMQFEVNLTVAKTRLADGLTAYTIQRMDTLPPCSAINDIAADLNPFNATCIPRGVDKMVVAENVRSKVMNDEHFLKDAVINDQDLRVNNSQEVQLGNITINRDTYNQTKGIMYFSGVLSIISVLAIVYLSSTRRSGVRRASIIAIVVGGLSMLIVGGGNLLLNEVGQRTAQSVDTYALQQSIVDIALLLGSDIRDWWLMYSLYLLGGGVVALIALRSSSKSPSTLQVTSKQKNQ